MARQTRRQFLTEVGGGMFVAGLGLSVASDLGLSKACADDNDQRLTFGTLEPLVDLLQETPPEKLLPLVVERIRQGLDLKQLTAAAALANSRAFGGEHYGGFHTFMALAPAYEMARELPSERQALPLLKVLYRNSAFLQATGNATKDTLAVPVAPSSQTDVQAPINAGDKTEAERRLRYVLEQGNAQKALEAALTGVEDNHDVHTVVLPWRAYALLDLTGEEHALTLLRQSVRKCAVQAVPRNEANAKELARRRAMVPKLVEQYKLLDNPLTGTRDPGSAWTDDLARSLLKSTDEQAAEAIATALSDGISPRVLIEAISQASCLLVLCQAETSSNYGRRTHGDSMGVHASDTTNAWRNLLHVCGARHRAAGLMLAAANVASSAKWALSQQPPSLIDAPFPHAEQLAAITAVEADALLTQLDGAIRESDQITACAVASRYGALHYPSRKIMDVLLKYAISEDGRLHSEKYYRTVTEEFAATRDEFRWRQIAALARVTASSYGLDAKDKPAGRAPGYEQACQLLGVS